MDIMKLQGLVYELKNLSDKTNTYRKSNDYIYTEIYKAWIDEFNNLLKKYNAITDLKINSYITMILICHHQVRQ